MPLPLIMTSLLQILIKTMQIWSYIPQREILWTRDKFIYYLLKTWMNRVKKKEVRRVSKMLKVLGHE